MSKKAIQFGAGNIGRGFIGQLLWESGYHTVFVDVVDELVEALNGRGEFPLRLVGDGVRDLRVNNVSAIHARDIDAVAEAMAEADIGATAVGVSVLPRVAPLIAAGVRRRYARGDEPCLNLVICENMIGAGPFLREEVRKHLPAGFHGYLDDRVGFVEASIGRMVPVMTEVQRTEDPLLVCVEPYSELPVDARGFKGPIPEIRHMEPRDNFEAYVERKLFIHNAGHAATAYLGHLRGHEYIWQAAEDPVVRAEADAATEESREALARKYGLDRADLDAHWADLRHRFSNRALADQVARICKDPIRKLGPNDRLIGAARMCLEQGISPKNLSFAAAAAIRYHNSADPAACALQGVLEQRGLDAVLEEVAEVPHDSPLNNLIKQGMERLREEGWVNA